MDFDAARVVLISMGEQATGGYSIELVTIEREGTDLRVRFVERSPGLGCVTTQALTQPTLVVAVPRTAGTIVFDAEEELVNCG